MTSEYHAPTFDGFIAHSEHEHRPSILLAAFEGWNDAGSAASDAVRRILRATRAERLTSIGLDDFYDYQFTRPTTKLTPNGRIVQWPKTDIYKIFRPKAAADLLVVLGVEPTFRWQSFCAQIVEEAQKHHVGLALTLGSLLADVPHTRPVPTIFTSDNSALQEYLKVSASTYEGPTGIPSVLGMALEESGIPTSSLWAQLSHYVAQAPSPRVELALLELLEELLPLMIPTDQLREDALAWRHGVDELTASDPDVAKYVKQLEEATDASELPEASGETIAREFERYLRRRGRNRTDGQGPDFEI
ncbi:PAC2 family protein [Glutamicibacter sp.]|uniref:proteasome assembly chaperone family protein n=1 Tax=Glutamicibacter sp. TaxID=1931995 RepID=UPI0028BF51EA|nr:PAC2 family protein [Glutamicibacter sp.]